MRLYMHSVFWVDGCLAGKSLKSGRVALHCSKKALLTLMWFINPLNVLWCLTTALLFNFFLVTSLFSVLFSFGNVQVTMKVLWILFEWPSHWSSSQWQVVQSPVKSSYSHYRTVSMALMNKQLWPSKCSVCTCRYLKPMLYKNKILFCTSSEACFTHPLLYLIVSFIHSTCLHIIWCVL